MINSITRITLNLQETNTMVSIKAKRGDTSRKLLIHLSDGSIPYHISDDCYATFTAKKPDGTKINNPCTIENNVIAYEFTEQTCAAPGTMHCEIKLYGASRKLITSACFLVNVYDTVFRDGDEVSSEGEMNTLDDLIQRANAFLNETGKLLRWQGNWDSETEYEANDLVLHEEVLYVAEDAIAADTVPGSEEVTAWVPIAGMGSKDYVLTDDDKAKIAELAAKLVKVPDSGKYSTYYMDGEVDYPVEGFASHYTTRENLSNGGSGVKVGDLLISSNGVLCTVTAVNSNNVSYKPIAKVSGDSSMEQLKTLIEEDMLPAVHNASGAILTDTAGNIILRY